MTRASVLRRPTEEAPPPRAHVVDIRDEILELDEAAAFMKVSPSWLYESDVPRASFAQRGKPKGPVRFLKSQLIAYTMTRLNYRIDVEAQRA